MRNGWQRLLLAQVLIYYYFPLSSQIAGVVTPHDGKCHLQKDRNGIYEYTEAERLVSVQHLCMFAIDSSAHAVHRTNFR